MTGQINVDWSVAINRLAERNALLERENAELLAYNDALQQALVSLHNEVAADSEGGDDG